MRLRREAVDAMMRIRTIGPLIGMWSICRAGTPGRVPRFQRDELQHLEVFLALLALTWAGAGSDCPSGL